MVSRDWLSAIFESEFGQKPSCFRSPGRINLIGEHTDYNQGFVLPAGIDLYCHIAIGLSDSDRSTFISLDLDDKVIYEPGTVFEPRNFWANYILGVKEAFEKMGIEIPQFNLIVRSDVPIGAGLSSSAALESVVAYSLNRILSLGLDQMELTKIAKAAENDFIGLQCGIMDMFASIHAKKDSAMLLDCRSLSFEYVPLELTNNKLVLFDTKVKHQLADSEYNTRRLECQQAVKTLKKYHPGISSLRDVDHDMLLNLIEEMPENIYRRALHVVGENERLHRFTRAVSTSDWTTAGSLLYDSHDSLKNNYEVSCRELDLLVDSVKDMDGVWGGRMMGGGFGGCTLNLIREEEVERVIHNVNNAYRSVFGVEPKHYIANTSDGASSF